jgi:hypothetical protein
LFDITLAPSWAAKHASAYVYFAPPFVAHTGLPSPGTQNTGVVAAAAAIFFLPLASPVAAEPITKAAAVTATNAKYPMFLSFIFHLPGC